MFGNHGATPTGFNSIEALRDNNPEMAGAVDVVYRRMAIMDKALENTRRALGIVPTSQEVHQHAAQQESFTQTVSQEYDPVAEAEAVLQRAAAERQRQAAMGAGARERLQTIPDNNPTFDPGLTPVQPVPPSEVESQIAFVSQIADNRYNNLHGMN